MESLSEILDDIKKRLTSPFIFSFIISWLLWNWRIPLGLIWYDSVELKAVTGCNVWDFIVSNVQGNTALCYPLVSSLIYTVAFPWINYVFKWYNSWTVKNGEDINFQIAGDTYITLEAYSKLKKDYANDKAALQAVITDLKNDQETSMQRANTIAERDRTLADLQKRLNTITNSEMLNGEWDVVKGENSYRYKISANTIIAYHLQDEEKEKLTFSIDDFYYSEHNKTIFFIRKVSTNKYINYLQLPSNQGEIFNGTENNEPVTYHWIREL